MANRIDIEEISDKLTYNSETGVITWKKSGKRAGNRRPNTYIQIRIGSKRYAAHRIAWALHNGEDPGDSEIDHIDRDKNNNRINNLRIATRSQNLTNVDGRTGISRNGDSWRARVQHHDTQIHIGTYKCPLIAHVSYVDKVRELQGEYSPR